MQRFHFHVWRHGNGDERVLRDATHRGDVAERAAERLTADAARLVAREEMHAFHYGVGFQQLPALVARLADHRAIIAGPDAHIRAERQRAGKLRNEPVLAVAAELHGFSMPVPCA